MDESSVDSPDHRTRPWHALEVDTVLADLDSQSAGLSQSEAERRVRRYGSNRLSPARGRSPLTRFALQFHNLLIYVLIAAALVTALLQHWVDTGVIIGVVLINALVGFIQEGKAERALDALKQLLAHQAMVRRDGQWHTVAATELVPGDVVALQSGDKVPADLRMMSVRDLRIDESMLTGESVPVDKGVDPVAPDSVLGDRRCVAYSGTMVTAGTGTGIVVQTGQRTEVGRISELMHQVPALMTPLLRKMAQFSRWLTAAILALASLTFVFGTAVRGFSWTDMFVAAVGLAVAAIPEGLPAIMTITLAIGVQRMARRNAIIRRLPAVETLGAVTVICSDKTGTLTRNEMTVRSVALAHKQIAVGGEGYDPHGGFALDGTNFEPGENLDLGALVRAALLCNDAELHHLEGRWQVSGDPTEGALLALAMKTGLVPAALRGEFPRTDVIPFESEHRFMATLHHDHSGHGFVYVKGAPERILEMCAWQRRNGEREAIDRAIWETQMQALAARGERVLALAWKPSPADHRELHFGAVESGLVLLGMVGMIDPPRSDAIEAIRSCHDAGIAVKMITGDHLVTARAVGQAMGIGTRAIPGAALDGLSDAQLRDSAVNTDIFARTNPEHKLRLVTALQADGNVVAMTGDGVNDAPALKRADVGIAMGQKGTEVAKEASEVVLTDDNFASIARAVVEGRTVFDNLKKAITFVLPTNGGEALTILVAVVMGRELPITPAQILWVNMVTAVTLALALAFEPAEPDVMSRPPRAPAAPLLSAYLLWRTALVAVILLIGTFGLFVWYRDHGADLATARTVAVNTLVLFEIFYLFNCRQLVDSALSRRAVVGNRYIHYAIGLLLVLQLLFTYAAPMQYVFSTTALAPVDWLRMVTVAFAVFLLVEVDKAVVRRSRRTRAVAAR